MHWLLAIALRLEGWCVSRIVITHVGEPDEIAKCKCGAELQAQSVSDDSGSKVIRERAQFAYALTHKKNGAPIRDLETKGPMLGIIELGWCDVCQHHCAILDSTDDKEYWASLPKWHKAV